MIPSTPTCTCQDQHRRGYCTEPCCPYSTPALTDAGALADMISALKAAETDITEHAKIIGSTYDRRHKSYKFDDEMFAASSPGSFAVVQQIRATLRKASPQETRGDEPVAWLEQVRAGLVEHARFMKLAQYDDTIAKAKDDGALSDTGREIIIDSCLASKSAVAAFADAILALLSPPGPMVPWELDCHRKICAAPVCECLVVTSTLRGGK